MKIQVVAGAGTGPTKLSAFDVALNSMGIANYNLIRLSSIVPPGSKIVDCEGPIKKAVGTWGDRLYVVIADTRVDTPNVEAWAGIGWVQEKGSGKGLFVEHEGANEKTVRRDIKASLNSLMSIRKEKFGPIHMKVVGRTCTHEPVCALVIAVFGATGWEMIKADDSKSTNRVKISS
ncbi:MAG TPA: pyruvoyl-dependent arginine decarboxylase [Candidatus Saccharimonadales bacterium]|nr:pyruvoyl-dependent arginine decarboxylase [Candidatus Saccharimonadales bacterium]